ncbi:MAG TPA: hypothetical protein VGW40_13235 [Allosphingosinicella sp.]|nr:hypothetical protein [Allosphingosinicella sp.]
MSETRPRSILWFERLVYLGLVVFMLDSYLTLDQVGSDWASAVFGPGFIGFRLVLTIALELLFVWLIAYRAIRIARSIFVGLTLLGFLVFPIAGFAELRAYGYLSLVTLAIFDLISLIEIWLLFRRDSRDWFAGRRQVDPEIFS